MCQNYNMSSHEKLLERFLKLPKDFTWDELKRLMKKYGYAQNNKGKTSGSRVRFESEESDIYLDLHKPHPKKHSETLSNGGCFRVFEKNRSY